MVSDREVSDAVEVHGQLLMVHASATCSGLARQARAIQLPRVVDTVVDEANTVVCHNCTSFQTVPMRAGEVQLYSLIN